MDYIQHGRLPYPSLSPGVCSNSCPLSWWYCLTISSSATSFSFCLQSSPASVSFPMSQLFVSGGQSVTSASSVLPINIQVDFLQDWLVWSSFSPRDSQESSSAHHNSKAAILQCSAFFMVQFSHPYMTTGKTITLTLWTFDDKGMSLLFNMLSRFVITFLRSNHFLSLYSFLSVSYFIVLFTKEQALLFTKVVVSFDIPTSTVWEFQLLHILLNTWYCQTFFF